ncbi:hypothetical protein ACN23B_18460 [Anabaena sp. FACHB-709]|uniref:Uncharacterized protein n=2 Tax=Nostocaceae TaxID=1162 RepID=A0A1Z4KK08_ANAVA|nr:MULTISPECIES: hypothetical protein [Nostocaceae]BAY69302.1 hypothetical protein NIES23_20960 [Trichormus variabilis NIES-23]HBW30597.1 hypothetical protein [Nostoc sp. UBA8866]MBD2174676.1 hypothetical protein [Anabaena cylindrica FACHB-318]MBD2266437.1 hypothetical protein [Anabaena sp. FACHB-709]MBD2275849.1 hypothetical protein [Nostoc sp. PCC 7120 = FACHB-418]
MTRSSTHPLSSIIPFKVISQIDKKIRTFPLIFLLLFPVPVWLVTELVFPQIVRAYTARVDLTIDRLPDEAYETILRRAEMSARAAAQRSFDQDILVTDISVIISVQSNGAIAPVLALDVSRQQWRTRPDPQRWATYFKSARSLLFFEQPQSAPNPAAAVTIPSPDPNPVPTESPAASPQPTVEPANQPPK